MGFPFGRKLNLRWSFKGRDDW